VLPKVDPLSNERWWCFGVFGLIGTVYVRADLAIARRFSSTEEQEPAAHSATSSCHGGVDCRRPAHPASRTLKVEQQST
jgi:hypothetical protein